MTKGGGSVRLVSQQTTENAQEAHIQFTRVM